MNRVTKIMVLVAALAVTVVVISGCSRGYAPDAGSLASPASASSGGLIPAGDRVQVHDGGNVTVEVKWEGVAESSLVFSVAMNTHSVDLDPYDLAALAVLRDDTGNEYYPVSWSAAAGGHHRRGTLAFPLPDSVSQGSARYIEMVIRDVAGIEERVLKWEL